MLVTLFAVIGSITILTSLASSYGLAIEPESGDIASSATKVYDPSASSGEAVKFNQVSSGNTGQFIRKIDTGPQASTYGHTPYGSLKTWTGGSTISEGSAPRDSDGWMRLKGYSFSGPIFINAKKVALIDCKVTMSNTVGHSVGTVDVTRSGADEYLIDHCEIDQNGTGWSLGGVVAYKKGTIRYSYIHGSGDGMKIGSDSLVENNYVNNTGEGTETSPGHIDGIQGSEGRWNWTARHNTFIVGVHPEASVLAAGAEDGPENGGNICVWAASQSAKGPQPSYGVVAEDNYCNGFNAGVSLQGTDPQNPNIVRNNAFGKNFRYYPGLRIRPWPEYPHTIVENNNQYDMKFNEATGDISPY